jgi:uncharacterized RDD family membrane protein YckC
MSSGAELPESDTAAQTTPVENVRYVGLVTRVLSWLVDVLLINLVATLTGGFVALILSIFPITKGLQPLFTGIAGGVYILWTAAYFVVFWSMTGQTPGARVMQVRLVTPDGRKVKPVRAFVRWVGMNVGLLPLPWGYVPIPFKRKGFPDWLAHTRVIDVDAEQLSLVGVRRERMRQGRDASRRSASAPNSELSADGELGLSLGLTLRSDEPASQDTETGPARER